MADPQSGEPAVRRCGFIALIGAPNVGKSTLINAIVGAKVAIVSHKVQTTRALLRGIATEADTQLGHLAFRPTRPHSPFLVTGGI